MKTKAETRMIWVYFFALLALIPMKGFSQPGGYFPAPIRIGIHCDPLISWLNTNTTVNASEGVRPGFDFGVNFYRYFAPNYAFSTGIGFMNAGGRLSSSETTTVLFNSFSTEVLPGKEVVYKLKYLTMPFGLKLQTNQIGYLTFFSDIGFDARILLSSRINIPSEGIENESGQKEVKPINIGWHVTFGGEYSLGGSTALTGGIGFDDNFFDVTKDNVNANQVEDRSLLKFVRFRLGVIF
jgi:hypothetical protein